MRFILENWPLCKGVLLLLLAVSMFFLGDPLLEHLSLAGGCFFGAVIDGFGYATVRLISIGLAVWGLIALVHAFER